jgi:uncharacterized membrane protein YkoI
MKIKSGWGKVALMTATLSGLLAFGAAQARDENTARHEAQGLEKAKISLSEAIRTAEKQGNGQAISAEYELKSSEAPYYEVKVLSNDGQKLTRYDLDAKTGEVKQTRNEKAEKLITWLKPTALQNAPTSLTRAIATAETRGGGKAREASVKSDGGQVRYDVEVVKADGTSEKFKVNGSDGKVASAK